MKLLHRPDLASRLSSCHLILDTNVFLHAVDNDDLYALLLDLGTKGCGLLTIPSVVFEFSRGAKSVEEYNWYIDYINNLGVSVYQNAEDQMLLDKAFSVTLQTECKKASCKPGYTDFLLMMLLHKFSHLTDKVYIMTSNYQDIPVKMFDRDDLLALEYRGGIQTQALYKNAFGPQLQVN